MRRTSKIYLQIWDLELSSNMGPFLPSERDVKRVMAAYTATHRVAVQIPYANTKWCKAGSVGEEYFYQNLPGRTNRLQHCCSESCRFFAQSQPGFSSMEMCCYGCNILSCSQTKRNDMALMMSLADIILPAKSAHLPALYAFRVGRKERNLVEVGSGSAYCTCFSEAKCGTP